jgi:hypothetical protein
LFYYHFDDVAPLELCVFAFGFYKNAVPQRLKGSVSSLFKSPTFLPSKWRDAALLVILQVWPEILSSAHLMS